MNRATVLSLLQNVRRAGNPAGAAAVVKAVATPTLSGGAVMTLDTLEARFDRRWADLGGPVLEREYRFDAVRKWRLDRVHLPSRTAIEIDGGVWKKGGGRHNRAAGYVADCTKLNAAVAAGWAVFRLTPAHLAMPGYLSLILRTIREREK